MLPLRRWAAHNTHLPSDRNIPETLRINTVFAPARFKEYSRSFLMVLRLIDFALVVFKLLMFKPCVITGISKIQVFNFSGTERVKQNQKKFKTIQNLLSLLVNQFLTSLNKFQIYFCFVTEALTILLPVLHCVDKKIDLLLNSNISKTVRTNIAFAKCF